MTKIDLNSDLGEGFGPWSLEDDDVLIGARAGITVRPIDT